MFTSQMLLKLLVIELFSVHSTVEKLLFNVALAT